VEIENSFVDSDGLKETGCRKRLDSWWWTTW